MSGKWNDTKECLKSGISDSPIRRFDRRATQAAIDTLDDHFLHPYYDRPCNDQPLLLKLSLLQPHYPYMTDEERFRYYLNRVTVFTEDTPFDHPFLSQRAVPLEGFMNEREVRRTTAAYYAMIEQVDAHIGEVLAKIEETGQNIDDWIIVYTSDHGEMLGQHGIWEKQKFFEGSARVPLFIRYPKKFHGRHVNENVNLCDLFATLCELSDLTMPEGPTDSRSLVQLMRGDSSTWSNETISQFRGTNCMIKQDALKYQCYGPDIPEVLFDLDRDPTEKTNLIHEAAFSDHLHKFRNRATELGFAFMSPKDQVT
jgi:choline-sulfatase